MENNDVWEEVKTFYREKFGTAPELVELAPVLDLLRLCASGSSNKAIAEFFGESEAVLMELFDAHLGFMGWENNLSFSPLRIYKELVIKDEDYFIESVIRDYGYVVKYPLNSDLHKMYESARLVERLERLFDEKWI